MKINQLIWAPLLWTNIAYMIPPSRYPAGHSLLPEFQWCDPAFFFFFSTLLRILIITEARVSLWMNFTSLSSSSFSVSMSIFPHRHLNNLSVRNLLSIYVLDFLCSDVLSLQQISGCLKSSVKTRAYKHEFSSTCLKMASYTSF